MNMLRFNAVGLSVLLITLLSSCNKSSTGPTQSSGNLIENPTFEVNGKPSLSSWVCDTSLATIVQAAPTGDGTWSLQLQPGWIPQQGFAQTYVSAQSGVGVYKLTVWMKSSNSWPASVSLGTWSQGQWVNRISASGDSSEWSMISVLDTLSPSPSDSIAVYLSAGATELVSGKVLFADVTLQKVQ